MAEETEEKHEKSRPVFWPRFEPDTSRIKLRNITVTPTRFLKFTHKIIARLTKLLLLK
jgi:hypothetical protein